MSFKVGDKVRVGECDGECTFKRYSSDGAYAFVDTFAGTELLVASGRVSPLFTLGQKVRVKEGAVIRVTYMPVECLPPCGDGVCIIDKFKGDEAHLEHNGINIGWVSISNLIPVEEPPVFKVGDRVKIDCRRSQYFGKVGTITCADGTSYEVDVEGIASGVLFGASELIPLTDKPKEEGIVCVWLPGTVEAIYPNGERHCLTVKTTRGVVLFPVTRAHAKDIRIGDEFSISLRRKEN